MADLKISQLSSATLPLAGTEVLPIVQSEHTAHVGALDTSKFIKFDDLTEAAVIGWIKDGIGDYYGVLCNHLSDQIQEMKTNTSGSEVPPWQS